MKTYRVITNGFEFGVEKFWESKFWRSSGWTPLMNGGYYPQRLTFANAVAAEQHIARLQREEAREEAEWAPVEPRANDNEHLAITEQGVEA